MIKKKKYVYPDSAKNKENYRKIKEAEAAKRKAATKKIMAELGAQDKSTEPEGERRRYVDYTYEIGMRLCEYVASGLSINKITKLAGMPSLATFFNWQRDHVEFAKAYALAKELQADTFVDEMVDISDDDTNDDQVKVGRDRLRVETRKWVAAKLRRNKYGDKVEVEHQGNIGVANLTNEELEAKINEKIKSIEGITNHA